MNKTIESQLNHRTIRKFKNKKVDENTLNTLFKVANRTASSIAMQSYSIIRITDDKTKDKISKICNQDYIKNFPELVIFIVDVYRNARISEELGENLPHKKDMDRFFQGFTDGAIAAQNMITAIESLDMGTVYLGSILNDPQAIIDLLELPRLTFPIVGVGFGYPDQYPMLKPRMDISLKVFENRYKKQENYLESIKEYDKEMKEYYDLRNETKSLDEFSKQVVEILKMENEKRSKLLNVVKNQGFNLRIEDK
ncbi:NADPH-dependent oxidoreductase [Senegalia massiliensis]|uniref:NADPH-dependent oxidoreductase n=1 Tax=Senegalia massiliensis TaxID=1720316 RepID=A0A845R222_9CLOT|nr:NADPH-dependent oxidoreductase [Senegalia massiliensis]NBI08029.1 NADPH-dependent oxidoreductase [Senegalia massiliensis]